MTARVRTTNQNICARTSTYSYTQHARIYLHPSSRPVVVGHSLSILKSEWVDTGAITYHECATLQQQYAEIHVTFLHIGCNIGSVVRVRSPQRSAAAVIHHFRISYHWTRGEWRVETARSVCALYGAMTGIKMSSHFSCFCALLPTFLFLFFLFLFFPASRYVYLLRFPSSVEQPSATSNSRQVVRIL